MSTYIIRRLLQSLLVMIVMSALVFLGLYVIGDPVSMMASADATELERDAIRASFGLDKPLLQQYGIFMAHAVRLDFGKSFLAGQPAMGLILERMPATLELATVAMLLSVLIGVPLGIWAGLKPQAISTRGIMTGSILGFSLPNFWVGLMLIMIFAVYLGWLPASGRGATVQVGPVALSVFTLDGWSRLVLPATTIALAKAALIIRVTRAATREALSMDYIKFARAKGLAWSRILRVHLLKNIMIPIVTVVGLEFGQVVAFAVVTETIFAWPGIGRLVVEAIFNRDFPVVQGVVLVVSLIFVTVNLLVDLAYAALDPRVRSDAA
jgi:peptide/nickel transport system permease protein